MLTFSMILKLRAALTSSCLGPSGERGAGAGDAEHCATDAHSRYALVVSAVHSPEPTGACAAGRHHHRSCLEVRLTRGVCTASGCGVRVLYYVVSTPLGSSLNCHRPMLVYYNALFCPPQVRGREEGVVRVVPQQPDAHSGAEQRRQGLQRRAVRVWRLHWYEQIGWILGKRELNASSHWRTRPGPGPWHTAWGTGQGAACDNERSVLSAKLKSGPAP